jgi:hypothetical protein
MKKCRSSKQTEIGVAQAELAVAVVGKFFDSLIESGEGIRVLLDAVKRVTQIAFDHRLARVCFKYGLKPLSSIPYAKIESENFQTKRWPRILAAAAKLKQKHINLQARLSYRPQTKRAKKAQPQTPGAG